MIDRPITQSSIEHSTPLKENFTNTFEREKDVEPFILSGQPYDYKNSSCVLNIKLKPNKYKTLNIYFKTLWKFRMMFEIVYHRLT